MESSRAKPDSITWDEFFMLTAQLASKRSKDPSSQIGACIVSDHQRIVATGYNGMPGGLDELPWSKEGSYHETKYPYVVHAELNAILNATVSLRDCVLYTTRYPCCDCAKAIVQSGIGGVIYAGRRRSDSSAPLCYAAATRILDMNGIHVAPYTGRTQMDVAIPE